MLRREFLKVAGMTTALLAKLKAKLATMSDEEILKLSPLGTVPQSPAALAARTWGPNWQFPPHLRLLNEKLTKVATGGIRRLLITMPPRHGKSLLTSEHFPAWYLGHYPDRRVILASYEADFASSWGRKARAILEEYGPTLFGVSVSKDSSAANRWDIEGRKGGMQTAGVGGPITGKGADLLLIDDPIKNSEDANSFTIRQKIWDWYQSTAYTRLEPHGAIVLIQTRWHGDDLAGRVLKESGNAWDVLNLPAIAGANDALGREQGKALWPERFNVADLAEIRQAVGAYYWSALYQQQPTEDEGGRVKREWLRHYEQSGDYYRLVLPDGRLQGHLLPKQCLRFIIVDCAGSSDDVAKEKRGKVASWSVISTFDYDQRNGVLVWRDLRRGRWEFPELLKQIKQAHREHNPAWIGIEDEKTGRAALQMLRGISTKPLSPGGKDKLTRAGRMLNMLEQGKIWIPRAAPWRNEWEAEFLAWTGHPDEQADQIDTGAYAAMQSGQGKVIVVERGGFLKGA